MVFLLGEVVARIIASNGMHYDIEMTKYAKQLKRKSTIVGLGHEHVPSSEADLMGVNVKINSVGMRDYEYPFEKNESTSRILVLGDSQTFGWGVPFDETYPKVLNRMLNSIVPTPQVKEYEVINLGVGNYNTAQELLLLKHVGLNFQPDIVILGFFVNDAEPTPELKSIFLLENSYLCVFLWSSFEILSIRLGYKADFITYYNNLYFSTNPDFNDWLKAIATFSKLSKQINFDFLVVLLPDLHDLSNHYPFRVISEKVVNACKRNGIEYLDLFNVFKGYSPEKSLWVSPMDSHYNGKAHKMVADGIYSWITKN